MVVKKIIIIPTKTRMAKAFAVSETPTRAIIAKTDCSVLSLQDDADAEAALAAPLDENVRRIEPNHPTAAPPAPPKIPTDPATACTGTCISFETAIEVREDRAPAAPNIYRTTVRFDVGSLEMGRRS